MSKSPKKASKAVDASYERADDGSPRAFKYSAGRPPSVLGDSQGDHVTAYRLVQEGLYNAISNLTDAEISGLSFLANRNLLRDKRGSLYNFISILGSLETKDNADILYSVIDDLLKRYQEKRHKKTQLRADTKAAQESTDLDPKSLIAVLSGIDAHYKFNGELIRVFFEEVSKYLITFYNKIPNTAFFAIKGFEASSSEGSTVSTSIKKMKKEAGLVSSLAKGSPALTAKLHRDIIPLVVSLIHYPQITDKDGKKAEDILGEHRSHTLTSGNKTARARDNDFNKLAYIMARHLHLTFAAFPDLAESYTMKDFADSFVSAFVKDPRTGWPSYNNPVNITQISDTVLDCLIAMQKATTDNHYTVRKKYTDELVSSDDEEELTIPSPRDPATRQSALQLSLEERAELDALRQFKQDIDNGVKEGTIVIKPGAKITPVTSHSLSGPGKPKMEPLSP